MIFCDLVPKGDHYELQGYTFFLPGYFEAQYHVEATAAQTAFIAMAVATVLNVTGNRRGRVR